MFFILEVYKEDINLLLISLLNFFRKKEIRSLSPGGTSAFGVAVLSCRLAPAICVGEPSALGKGLGADQAAAGIHHSRAGDASSPLKGFFRCVPPMTKVKTKNLQKIGQITVALHKKSACLS